MPTRQWFIIFSLGLLVGCGSPKEDPIAIAPRCSMGGSQSTSLGAGIIGGEAILAEDRLARAIVSVTSASGACTGVAIGPRLVLTAAHCFADVIVLGTPQEAQGVRLAFQQDLTEHASERPTVSAEKVLLHGGFSNETARHDLAVVVLREDLPAGTLPFALPQGLRPMTKNDYFYVAGFGVTTVEPGPPQPWQLFGKALRLEWNVHPEILDRVGLRNQWRPNRRNNPLIFLAQPRGGACDGDSGGPMFSLSDEDYELEGIASFVYNNKGLKSKSTCYSGVAYTSVRVYSQWIRSAAAELGQCIVDR